MKAKIELEICRVDLPIIDKALQKLKTQKTVKITLDYFTTLKEAMIK